MPTKKTQNKPAAAKTKATKTTDIDNANAPVAARPALRADTSGQGRTLDALGNVRS